MHAITSREVLEGNLKSVMRLILALAAHYKPQSVRHHENSNIAPSTTAATNNNTNLTPSSTNTTAHNQSGTYENVSVNKSQSNGMAQQFPGTFFAMLLVLCILSKIIFYMLTKSLSMACFIAY